MSIQKHLRFLLGLVYSALALGAAATLLPGLSPFLLGWGLACLLEPPVRFLSRKTPLRRSWTAAVILLLFLLLLCGGGFFLLRRLWYELAVLSARLPVWIDLLQNLANKLNDLLYRWSVAVSPDIRPVLQDTLTNAAARIGALLSGLGGALLGQSADLLTALPAAVFFLLTMLLACYFILAGRPTLSAFFRRQIPPRWLPRLDDTWQRLKAALGGWLRAQGILMAVTFGQLAIGFLLTGAEPALLLAAGVALLDALPVFGTGTILFPWASLCLLDGNFRKGLSLLILYAVIWLTRSILEPKLIADRAGLHPLASLAALYLGFRLFGVVGMLLAPLCAVFLRQLCDSGILTLWKN